MDEILHHSRPEAGTTISEAFRTDAQAFGLRDMLVKAAAAAQAGVRAIGNLVVRSVFLADRALAGRKMISAMPFLALAGVAAAALVISTIYTPSYVVTVDGLDLGTVTDPAVFEEIVDQVEDRASGILGYDYALNQDVEYTFALTQKDKISSVAPFETYLFNHVGEVMKSYVLTVDGEFIGASTSKADLDNMLAALAAPYVTDHTISVGYVESVDIAHQYTPSDIMQDLDSMHAVLSANTTGQTTYEVVKGDTYLGIAHANDMSLDELMALNPDANINRLLIGDVLTVKKTIPYLSICTVDQISYHEEIPSPIEEVQDSSMYKGDRKVLTAGTPGEAAVVANVTYINGYEDSRDIVTYETLTEPTTEVVAVGTKARPKTMPTGKFIWPLSGRITSKFGNRTIFGTYDFHGGLDIAANYGTTIAASDGGTVIWSGTKGTYGKLIIIDHGNGVHSYYGHCSKLLVSAGTKVYQGQAIARVGSTGRSTGNHCHFEIRINGNRVNPLSYLP